MFRRLITCLALITGLAASGAPLNAAMLAQVDRSVAASQCALVDSENHHVCVTRPAALPGRSGLTAPRPVLNSLAIMPPSVWIGPDRAYE